MSYKIYNELEIECIEELEKKFICIFCGVEDSRFQSKSYVKFKNKICKSCNRDKKLKKLAI